MFRRNRKPFSRFVGVFIALASVAVFLPTTAHAAPVYYQIQSLNRTSPKACLDVAGGPGATAPGAKLVQFTCYGIDQTNQQFYLELNDSISQTYRIRARHSGQCLDVTGGIYATGDNVAIQQWPCLSTPAPSNQAWFISGNQSVDVTITAESSRYTNSPKLLDVAGSDTRNDAPIIQFHANGGRNQHWKLVRMN